MNYDQPPAEIAKVIFVMPGRMAQEHALAQCPAEKLKQVRHCMNVFRERRALLKRMKREGEFWL